MFTADSIIQRKELKSLACTIKNAQFFMSFILNICFSANCNVLDFEGYMIGFKNNVKHMFSASWSFLEHEGYIAGVKNVVKHVEIKEICVSPPR